MKKLLIIIFSIFLVSCGARKVEKTKEDIKETKIESLIAVDTTKVLTNTFKNTLIITEADSSEFVITPIDSSKIMIVSGKEYKNAKIISKRHKTHKRVLNNDIIVKDSLLGKTNKVSIIDLKERKTASKVIDKKESKGFYPYLFVFLIILVILYLIRNKIRNLL